MVHLDEFWSTFYTNHHYDVHDINTNILKLHMLNGAAKRYNPEIFVQTFLGGGSTPVPLSTLSTGLHL